MEIRSLYSDDDFQVEICYSTEQCRDAVRTPLTNSEAHSIQLILKGTILQDQAKILSRIFETQLPPSFQQMILDLSGVHAISHRAIRVLLKFLKHCDQQRIEWQIAPLNETLQLVFKEMGVLSYFHKKTRSE